MLFICNIWDFHRFSLPFQIIFLFDFRKSQEVGSRSYEVRCVATRVGITKYKVTSNLVLLTSTSAKPIHQNSYFKPRTYEKLSDVKHAKLDSFYLCT